MGHLRQRGDAWELRVGVGGRTFTRTFRGSPTAARKALRAFELHLAADQDGGDGTTVGDLVELFILDAPLSPTTLAEYRRAQAAIPERLAQIPVWKVRAPTMNAAYREMAMDGVNVHTIRRAHEVISAAFSEAIAWGWAELNPCQHARPPARPRTERGAVSPAEVRKLIDVCPPPLALWVRLAFVTGARRGELCALQWGDIDLERGALVIRRNVVAAAGTGLVVKETKTGKVHAVALDALTVKALRVQGSDLHVYESDAANPQVTALSNARGVRAFKSQDAANPQVTALSGAGGARAFKSQDWLFTHDGERPWRPDGVTQAVRRLQKRHGLPPFPIHSIRHGTATELLDGGFPLGVASERLGHGNQTTTARIYAHALPARDLEAANYLGGLLG